MLLLLEFMERVAIRFDDEVRSELIRKDHGMIEASALFEEHCRRGSKPFAYQNCKNIQKLRHDFLFEEMIDCMFVAANLVPWLNTITELYRLIETIPSPTSDKNPNIYSPLHLMVDALVAQYVWSQLFWSNLC